MNDQECHQLNCLNARFGYSLASIGDVDWDGFPGQYNALALSTDHTGRAIGQSIVEDS